MGEDEKRIRMANTLENYKSEKATLAALVKSIENLMPSIHKQVEDQVARYANINPHFSRSDVVDTVIFEEVKALGVPTKKQKNMISLTKDCYVGWLRKHESGK